VSQQAKQSPLFNIQSKLSGTVAIMELDRVILADLFISGESVRVSSFAEHNMKLVTEDSVPTPEELVALLANAIDKSKSSLKNITIALPNSFFIRDIVTLPSIGKKNLEALINRKILKSNSPRSEDYAWCYEVLEKSNSDMDEGVKVLIARIPTSVLDKIHVALKKHGITPKALTLSLEGIMHLMDSMDPKENMGSLLTLDISSREAMLSFFVNRALHQIRYLKGDIHSDRERFNQMLRVEVQRTQAFHKEKYKGKTIEKTIVVGTQAQSVELCSGFLANSAHLEVDLPIVWLNGKKGAEVEPKSGNGTILLMTGLLLFANRNHRVNRKDSSFGINFKAPIKRTGLIAATLIVLLLVALSGIISLANNQHDENRSQDLYLRNLEDKTRPYSGLKTKHNGLLELTNYCKEMQGFYSSIQNESRQVSESILAISNHLPSGVTLSSLSFSRKQVDDDLSKGQGKIMFKIEGDFRGYQSKLLLDFIQSIQSLPQFEQVSLNTGGTNLSTHSEGGMTETVNVEVILK